MTPLNSATSLLDSITAWVSNTQEAEGDTNTINYINYTVRLDKMSVSELYVLPSIVLSDVLLLQLAFSVSTTAIEGGMVGYWQPSSGTLLAVSHRGTGFVCQSGFGNELKREEYDFPTNIGTPTTVLLRLNAPIAVGAGAGAVGSVCTVDYGASIYLLCNDKWTCVFIDNPIVDVHYNSEDTFPVVYMPTTSSNRSNSLVVSFLRSCYTNNLLFFFRPPQSQRAIFSENRKPSRRKLILGAVVAAAAGATVAGAKSNSGNHLTNRFNSLMHDVSKQDPIHWTEQQNLIDEIGQRDDTGAKTGVFKSLMHAVSKQDPKL